MSPEKPDIMQKSAAKTSTKQWLPLQKSSERGFLDAQAADARTAMSQTLHEMKKTLNGMIGLNSCAKQHPWIMTGSAVGVGFVTGAVLTPSREMVRERPRSNLEAELQANSRVQETPRTEKSFLSSILGTLLAGIVKTLVEGFIAAAVVTGDPFETKPTDEKVNGNAF